MRLQVWQDETLIGHFEGREPRGTVYEIVMPELVLTLEELLEPVSIDRQGFIVGERSFAVNRFEMMTRGSSDLGRHMNANHVPEYAKQIQDAAYDRTIFRWAVLLASPERAEWIFDHDDFEPLDSAQDRDVCMYDGTFTHTLHPGGGRTITMKKPRREALLEEGRRVFDQLTKNSF